MLTEGAFDTGELRLHFVQWTDSTVKAAPLILLHGIPQSSRYWTRLVETIGAERRVFALDSRGHGRSDWKENGYRLVDYPRDQMVFLREVMREPAVLVGHSLGGINAIYIAAEMPALVRAIVLEDPPLYFAERGLGVFEAIFQGLKILAETDLNVEQIALRIEKLTQAPLAFAREHAECVVQLDPRTLGQLLDGSAFESWNTDELLARIACPVLLTYGEAARGGALENADVSRAERKLNQCEAVFMPRAGHMIHTYRPHDFAGAVRRFLRRVD